MINALNSNTNTIHYAEKNFMYSINSAPNDSLYQNNQYSLKESILYADAHINIDSAWDFQVGKSYIKVGVIDHHVYWSHEDFGDGTFDGSNIKGGWDYIQDDSIKFVLAPYSSHGTSCAGIIGSLRNNNKGISGIAGGDIDSSKGGISLYSFGINILNNDTLDGASAICAIVEASCNNPETNFGYGLHIQNNSWGSNSYSQAHADAVKTAWRNECIFVAGRGNDNNDDAFYPASHFDNMVISVGASGDDGERFDGSNGDNWVGSSYGGTMDLIAPGIASLISAPKYYNASYNFSNCNLSLNNYSCFKGTSAAAPHVAGVASLLLSQHNTLNWYNNNLAPEDVEYLLETYASDRELPLYPGYDDKSGWGLLNAGNAMKHITGHYRIEHNSAPTNRIITTVDTSFITTISEINGVAPGNYTAYKHQVSDSYSDNFGSNATILDYWERLSSSNGCTGTGTIFNDYTLTYQFSNTTNTMYCSSLSYCYYIPALNKWIPTEPDSVKVSYSIHVYDTDWTDIESVNIENFTFNLFPNPTEKVLNLSYNLSKKENLTVEIYDSLGQLVINAKYINTKRATKSINVSSLSNGIYFVKLFTKNNYKVKKVIIH